MPSRWASSWAIRPFRSVHCERWPPSASGTSSTDRRRRVPRCWPRSTIRTPTSSMPLRSPILQSQPDRRFRGSQRVVEILTRAISGTHSPFAVVIDSNRERANETAGLLTRIGFEAVTAFTGREGFELAADRANVVLVAVHANVIRWPLSQTISNLRADARTAQIPIVIYGPESVRQQVAGALTHYPLIDYLSESSTEAHVESQVGPFLKRALALAETPANREQKIAEATAWLAEIARSNRTDIFPWTWPKIL